MMDTYSEYLSKNYSESSLDNPNHSKTIMIKKIKNMFHSLHFLVEKTKDEVSARCLLRGLLDSMSVYCFIYQNADMDEVMFRHYLYLLDGLRTYRDCIINGVLIKKQLNSIETDFIDRALYSVKEKLCQHPYSATFNKAIVQDIIRDANWKYETIEKNTKTKYSKIYKKIGFDANTANYFLKYNSQFVHGLCLSNTSLNNERSAQGVLYESILIADRIVNAIYNTFQDDFLSVFNPSDIINLYKFNIDELGDFVRAVVVQKDNIIIV